MQNQSIQQLGINADKPHYLSATPHTLRPTTKLPKSQSSDQQNLATPHTLRPITKLPKSKSSDHSWRTVHQQFTEYGRNAKEWLRKCILLLPQIEKQQIWRKKRFKNLYEYAAKLAGMSHYQVDDALWILRKIKDKPELMKVVEEKGLNAVRPIVAIATKENEAFLASKAKIMDNGTLRIFAGHLKKGEVITSDSIDLRDIPKFQSVNLQSLPFDICFDSASQTKIPKSTDPLEPQSDSELLDQSSGSLQSYSSSHMSSFSWSLQLPPACPSTPKVTIAMQLDLEIADQLQKLKGQSDWNETISQLLRLRQEKLDQSKPEAVEATSRPIPAAIESYVLAKTNSICAFPGCY